MRINHLIVGTLDVSASSDFYQKFLGFETTGDFVDTGTGSTGRIMHKKDKLGDLDILIVPFVKERLPSPQHIAFEVDSTVFEALQSLAKQLKFTIRAEPSLKSQKSGVGKLDIHDDSYQNFYVLDPSGINIEIMTKVKT